MITKHRHAYSLQSKLKYLKMKVFQDVTQLSQGECFLKFQRSIVPSYSWVQQFTKVQGDSSWSTRLWTWRYHVPLKCWEPLTQWHIISQKVQNMQYACLPHISNLTSLRQITKPRRQLDSKLWMEVETSRTWSRKWVSVKRSETFTCLLLLPVLCTINKRNTL